jgi:hypothetical protein
VACVLPAAADNQSSLGFSDLFNKETFHLGLPPIVIGDFESRSGCALRDRSNGLFYFY